MTPEQEAVVAALEAEIGRPLIETELARAESFLKQWRAAQAYSSLYGGTDQGVIADVMDRATYGVLSPGNTFESVVPTTYELAVAVGGFPTAQEVLFGVEGVPIRPDTPALYLERIKKDNYYNFFAGSPAGTDAAAAEAGGIDATAESALDSQLQQMMETGTPQEQVLASIILEQRAADDLEDQPKFLGGIPAGTLLPQNLAEVEQTFYVDAGKYQHTSQKLKKEHIEAGPDKPKYSITKSSNFPTEQEFGTTTAPSSNLDDKKQIKKAQASQGSKPVFGYGDYAPKMGSPTYLPMDQYKNFATKDPGYINGVQMGLVAAGLLKEDDVVNGVWTQDAAKAMEDAMIEANYTGGAKTWVDIVKGRAEAYANKPKKSGGGGGGGGGGRRANPLAGRTLVLPAYEKPDMDILNTEVKETMRQRLGRNPTGWELTLMADKLQEGYRADYDAQVVAAKANFEAGNRAILQSYRTGKPVTVTSQTEAKRVDPRAYLQERFEERYAPELELNKDRELSQENMSNVFNVLTSTSRILGGP
jgi:hypothetical protein